MKLDRPGIPLFLQFKLSHCMIRKTAREARNGSITLPYYRMYLRPVRLSNQHEMLLDLESAGNEVYYSAPIFHEPSELNNAYLSHNVKNTSVWIRPSWIGELPDQNEHYIAYNSSGTIYFCSEPKHLDANPSFENLTEAIDRKIQQIGTSALGHNYLTILAEQMAEISTKRKDISDADRDRVRDSLLERGPLAKIAYYANTFFDCQLFIVQLKEDNDSNR